MAHNYFDKYNCIVRIIIIYLFAIPFIKVSATEQVGDLLIFKSDTIGIYTYPLDSLIKSYPLIQKKILNYSYTMCGSSSCWRGYIGTWKVENDSLFLIKVTNGCEDYTFKLNRLFNIRKTKNGKIFADWFTGVIKGEYNFKHILIDGTKEYMPTKILTTTISNGKIIDLKIEEISYNKKMLFRTRLSDEENKR